MLPVDDDLSLREPLLVQEDGDVEDSDGSRFRRLIEQTPPDFLTRVRHRFLSRNSTTEQVEEDNMASDVPIGVWRSIFTPSMTVVSLLTLYFSQAFLTWVSLASGGWMEVRLRLPFHADLSIKTFGLSQLIQQMYDAEIGPPTFFLWIFSLVIPSLFTIFAPSFILKSGSAVSSARIALESIQHAPFAAIYIMNLLAAFHNVGSADIRVYTEGKPPIAAFASGILCSMLYVTIVRLRMGIPKHEENEETIESDDEDSVPMRILEDMSPLSQTEESPGPPAVAFWKKFVMFQLGLLSVFLWVPTFFFPYCTVTVDSGWLQIFEKEIMLGQILMSLPSSLMALPVVFGPLAATMAAFAAWMLDARSKLHVYALRPWIGGINLALTLWGVFHLVPKILVFPTLSFRAEASWGLYISLVQTICIELFVEGTIMWLP